MDEVQDGELLAWDTIGTRVAGVLVDHTSRPSNKGPGECYNVKTKDGVVAFFATVLLQKKLKDKAMGTVVDITYTELTKTNDKNDLKHFKVLAGPATAENLASVGLSADMMESTGEDGDPDFGPTNK